MHLILAVVLSAVIIFLAIQLFILSRKRTGETEESKRTTLEEASAEAALFKFLKIELGEEFLDKLSADEGLKLLSAFVERKRAFINAHPYLNSHEDEYLDHLQELLNDLSSTRV